MTRWLSQTGALARFFFSTITAWPTLPGAGRRVAARVFVNQVWFTALQAIPLVIVLSGTVTNYVGDDPSCTPHAYSAGSTFVDEGGTDVHILRNESGAQAETLAVQLIPSTAGRRIDMPAPGNCPF